VAEIRGKKEGRKKIKDNKIEEKLARSGRISGAQSYERKRKI
jgi:hypothetical protein